MTGAIRGLDRVEVIFDDPSLVADAGLVVSATLMVRLGLETLVDQSGAPGRAGRAGKVRAARC